MLSTLCRLLVLPLKQLCQSKLVLVLPGPEQMGNPVPWLDKEKVSRCAAKKLHPIDAKLLLALLSLKTHRDSFRTGIGNPSVSFTQHNLFSKDTTHSSKWKSSPDVLNRAQGGIYFYTETYLVFVFIETPQFLMLIWNGMETFFLQGSLRIFAKRLY